MADNNYPVEEVGGIQKIYCPVCGKEVAPLESYHMDFQNRRMHYPTCYQKAMLEAE